MEKLLQEMGLTEQQAHVYLALLQSGPLSVKELARRTNLARVSCYDTLNRLRNKGYVSVENRRSHRTYSAADPERLLYDAKLMRERSERMEHNVTQAVTELRRLKNTASFARSMTLEGIEGMKTFFEMMLSAPSLRIMGATGNALSQMQHYFPQWNERRKELKIKTRILFNDSLRGDERSQVTAAQVRYLPREYSTPATVFIFGDKVGTLLWEEQPVAFVMVSESIAKSYEHHFSLIWKVAKG